MVMTITSAQLLPVLFHFLLQVSILHEYHFLGFGFRVKKD